MARIFISPDGSERSFREPRERCMCGAMDCVPCRGKDAVAAYLAECEDEEREEDEGEEGDE